MIIGNLHRNADVAKKIVARAIRKSRTNRMAVAIPRSKTRS